MRTLKAILLAVAAAALVISLGVGSASAATLETGGVKQNASLIVELSPKPGTSTSFVATNGAFVNTCTGMSFKMTTTSPYTGTAVQANIPMMWGGLCAEAGGITKLGKLSITWIPGTTNGTVAAPEMGWRFYSTTFGVYVECKPSGEADIGTITGAAGGHATFHTNGVLNCGFFLPSVKLEGSYTITSPTGLGVAE